MENNSSWFCQCKDIYKEDNNCIDCKSYKYMDYNPDYPEKVHQNAYVILTKITYLKMLKLEIVLIH